MKFLGRVKDMASTIREREVASKQMGRRENKIINIEGRVQFDLLQVGHNYMHQIYIFTKKHFLIYFIIVFKLEYYFNTGAVARLQVKELLPQCCIISLPQ